MVEQKAQQTITRELLDQAHPDAVTGISGISILTLARDNTVCLSFVDGVLEVVSPDQFNLSEDVLKRKNDRELLSYLMLKGLTDEQILQRMSELKGEANGGK